MIVLELVVRPPANSPDELRPFSPFISSGMEWTRVDLHHPTDFLYYSGVKYPIARITETELWCVV